MNAKISTDLFQKYNDMSITQKREFLNKLYYDETFSQFVMGFIEQFFETPNTKKYDKYHTPNTSRQK